MIEDVFTERLLERARVVGLSIDAGTIPSLWRYYQLLERWNRSINLTALPLTDFPALTLDRLLLEAAVAVPKTIALAGEWVDLGSGGGSPAIPLAVGLSSAGIPLRLTLTESRGKKAAFLREVVRALPIPAARVLGRFEELLGWPRHSASLITCRAVHLDDIGDLVNHLLAPEGRLLFFGANVVEVDGVYLVDSVRLPSGDGVLSVLGRRPNS